MKLKSLGLTAKMEWFNSVEDDMVVVRCVYDNDEGTEWYLFNKYTSLLKQMNERRSEQYEESYLEGYVPYEST